METSVNERTVTFFVPLMITIVIQLSTLAREIADEPQGLTDFPPLFVPDQVRKDSQLGEWLPNLGRLNYLHATNMAILGLSFVLISALPPQPIKNIAGLLVIIVWLQLPLLEVDEYDKIRDGMNNGYPRSLYFHIGTTLLLIAAIVGPFDSGKMFTSVEMFSSDIISTFGYHGQLFDIGILALLFGGSALGFLYLLESEAEDACSDSGQGPAS